MKIYFERKKYSYIVFINLAKAYNSFRILENIFLSFESILRSTSLKLTILYDRSDKFAVLCFRTMRICLVADWNQMELFCS